MELESMEKVPLNSIDFWIWTKFHGIPWNLGFCCLSSMESDGTTGVVQMLSKKFHRTLEKVPWNFLIQITCNEEWKEILMIVWCVISNAGITRVIMQILMIKNKLVKETYKKIEFAYYSQGSISIQLSSMEIHGIPWNLMIILILEIILFLNYVVIWLIMICYLAKISQKRYIFRSFQYSYSYFEHHSVRENGTRSAKIAFCYYLKQC